MAFDQLEVYLHLTRCQIDELRKSLRDAQASVVAVILDAALLL